MISSNSILEFLETRDTIDSAVEDMAYAVNRYRTENRMRGSFDSYEVDEGIVYVTFVEHYGGAGGHDYNRIEFPISYFDNLHWREIEDHARAKKLERKAEAEEFLRKKQEQKELLELERLKAKYEQH
jgi:hypothetical protein